jgi:multiple sugar transport system substrate-binding protein
MTPSSRIALKGITWGHSRGLTPMVATAQRFCETHPGTEITWVKRTLEEFGHYPLARLAENFDLMVIDHPFMGHAARNRLLIPLDEHLGAEFLSDQARNSVGESHSSYAFDNHAWALAIDAAAPVSSWRPDLLDQIKLGVPESWEELLELARRGLVVFPAIAVDSLMNFYMFCCALEHAPFASAETLIEPEIGARALIMLRELVSLCSAEILTWNPIATYEAMSSRDDLIYCPFAFGYSNYARKGYGAHCLEFGDLPHITPGAKARSTLGGAGLAISSSCRHRDVALEYACFVASPQCQRTLYVENGGQPGHRAAWTDEEANRLTNQFFRNTLPALERAYLRPRYDGYIGFQEAAGPVVHEFLTSGGDPEEVIQKLEALYRLSRKA